MVLILVVRLAQGQEDVDEKEGQVDENKTGRPSGYYPDGATTLFLGGLGGDQGVGVGNESGKDPLDHP